MALCKQIENTSMLFHKDKKPMKGIFSPCKKIHISIICYKGKLSNIFILKLLL